jgi:hypothetical protein
MHKFYAENPLFSTWYLYNSIHLRVFLSCSTLWWLSLRPKRVVLIVFFIIKPTRCTNFTNLFRHETLHVWDSSSAYHQEFIHCALSNSMSFRFVDSFRAGPSSEISASSWFYYKEICYDARSDELKFRVVLSDDSLQIFINERRII